MLAHHVGEALAGCTWVGVTFAGGMAELPYITARTILVNDKHRHIINLARVVADDLLRPELVKKVGRKAFHPDTLKAAQEWCKENEPGNAKQFEPNLPAAVNYFVCCWMNRASKAGIDDEFNGRPAIRWRADGGDSNVRYRSAIRMLGEFSRTLKRCTFETMDCFDFLARCEDAVGHGIYNDPPFPGVGRRYRHNAGKTDDDEMRWHQRLRDQLLRFRKARIVCRFYDHQWIRGLYPESGWAWKHLTGRKQSNDSAPEVLLVRNGTAKGLFT